MDQETKHRLSEDYAKRRLGVHTADSADEDTENVTWETDIDSDPMITTSLRLPKSLLDWVRDQAEDEDLKPTALIRRWIEQRRRDSARARTPSQLWLESWDANTKAWLERWADAPAPEPVSAPLHPQRHPQLDSEIERTVQILGKLLEMWALSQRSREVGGRQ
jgi:hypothetical protein